MTKHEARIDARCTKMSMIARLADGNALLLSFFNRCQRGFVGWKIAKPTISVKDGADWCFGCNVYIGLGVESSLAHEPRIGGNLLGAVAKDAA